MRHAVGVRITILGHASVLVEAGDQTVLVDPLFADRFAHGAIGFHPARTIHRDRMPEPTAIVVTHLHLDHWHAPTLEQFDRDITVIAPADERVQRGLDQLGFTNRLTARPWEPIVLGGLVATPTPSDAEIEEFGLVVRHGDAVYWHMSDCDARVADGERVRDDHGPVAVVAARYQPITPLISYQRTLGIGHDERDGIAAWLEAACATAPAFVFPYFCDIDYLDEHAWANRYARPYHPAEIVALLGRRLAGTPTVAATVAPGDVIEIHGPDRVDRHAGAAAFVDAVPGDTAPFEPIDTTTLVGLTAPADREELERRLHWWLGHEFVPWLDGLFASPGSVAHEYVARQVVWQMEVHFGDGDRLVHHIDFAAPEPRLLPRRHPFPNYLIHVGGRALLDVLRGDGGSELFWLAATARVYEKLLYVADGRITAPPERGWDLFETLPEPLSWCLRKHGPGGVVAAFR